jgi:hypothetical protein
MPAFFSKRYGHAKRYNIYYRHELVSCVSVVDYFT